MSIQAQCPQCGAALPEGFLQGLCPRCMARQAEGILAARTDAAPSPSVVTHDASRITSPTLRYFGDYELLEEIARGGMGVVWKARQVSLNRIVAVKVLLAGKFSSPEFVQRFRQEAEAAANLQHPNIVAIHEVGEHEGQQYFSMDYVEGPSLAQLAREQPLSPKRAAGLVQSIAEAVHYAHQRGVIHRDLKPSNVLIDASDQPRVTDFGLAKRVESGRELRVESKAASDPASSLNSQLKTLSTDLTLTGQVLGTPGYMPPEQAGGRRGAVTAVSDVYSLGALLYFLVTGRAPFAAGSLEETLHQVLEVDPVSPRLLNPAVPRDLETICLKCLEKDPPKRYATAQALAEELGRFLNDEPIHARPAGPAEKLWRWCRRKPALAALFAAVFLLLLTVAIVSTTAAVRIKHALAGTARAQRETTTNLWDSYLAQARANRFSGRMGRRFDSLDALAKAAAIRPSPELRDEAIAALALSDVRVLKRVGEGLPEWLSSVPDENLERYAITHTNGEISVHRMADDAELLRLPVDPAALPKGSRRSPPQLFAFSHDGRFLAARQSDRVVSVWNLETRAAVKLGRSSVLNEGFGLDFSPDDRVVAVADDTEEVRLHDPADGSLARTLTAPCPVHLVRFSPDGRCLAVSSSQPGGVFFLDAVSGEVLAGRRFEQFVNSVAWHPGGALVATDDTNGLVQVWAWRTGKVLNTLARHTEVSFCRVFHPKSDLLFSAGYDGGHVWNFRSGEYVLRIPGDMQALRLRPDGTKLFARLPNHAEFRYCEVAADDPIRRFTPEELTRFAGWMAAFSPDGALFLNTTADGFLVIHDARTGRTLAQAEPGMIQGMAFDAQTNLWTSGTNRWTPGLTRWPLRHEAASNRWTLGPPEIIDPLDGPPTFHSPLAISGDGRTLVHSTQNRCFIRDSLAPDAPRTAARYRENWHYLALTPDGKTLATANWNTTGAVLWDTASGRRQRVIGTNASLPPGGRLLFSPDGQWLAVSGRPDIIVWRTSDWTLAWKVNRNDNGACLAFTPDSRLLAVRYDKGEMRLFAVESGQVLASFELPGGHLLNGVYFSPDGSQLALCGALTGDVFMMDLRKLRGRLAAMGLDWDLPASPPEVGRSPAETMPVSVIIKSPVPIPR